MLGIYDDLVVARTSIMTVKSFLSATTIVVGLVLFILGFVVQFSLFPKILESQVYENLKLEEGTEAWDGFVEPPVPVYMQFRFFNVTNPDKIKMGEKPEVKEVGPYVYVETRRKEDIFAVGDDQINYAQYYAYSFDGEKTTEFGCPGCTDQDEIVVINPFMLILTQLLSAAPDKWKTLGDVANNFGLNETFVTDLVVANLPEDLEAFKPIIVSAIQKLFELPIPDYLDSLNQSIEKEGEDIVVSTTPDELLYSGFEPKLLDVLFGSIGIAFGPPIDTLLDSLKGDLKATLCPTLPEPLADCKFGLFKGGNGTKGTSTGSYYTINSGKHEIHKFLHIEKFRGSETLPDEWWPFVAPIPSAGDVGVQGVCHEIYGSDGTQFPPFVEKEESKWLFVSELCRSIWLDFDTEVEVEEIEAYRYRPPIEVFQMTNPNNYCYCPEFEQCAQPYEDRDEWNTTACYEYCKDGFIKVGECYGGLPLIMSAPHYWNVDSSLHDQIIGLNADRDKHDTYLDIEPITGVALSAHKRIQVSDQNYYQN